MSVTVPDQALMAEAADEIKRLKLEVASLKKDLIEANERAEDADDPYESVLHKSANDQEKLEKEREELENKIEFLEADRLRLANLIHPDTPGCDVVAGRCHLCTEAIKRRDEGVRVLCDAVERMINDLLLTEGEAEALTEALEKVRRELE